MLLLILAIGCSKPADNQPEARDAALNPQPSTLNQSPSSALKLHWLGKRQLARETNATNFMAIWNLPESAKLEAQTLDKLSTAPWRLLKTPTALSNAPAALLRPLLDDLVHAESYLEIRGDTNQPGDLVFAIRLDPERAGQWRTNLAIIFESISGNKIDPGVDGWRLAFPISTSSSRRSQAKAEDFRLELARAGDWTILALADLRLKTSGSRLLTDFKARIQRDRMPFAPRATNFWLHTEADPSRLQHALSLGWQLPSNTPAFALTTIGEGGQVRTHARFDFPSAAPVELEPWNIPTNLVHDPLIGFMALRGFRPLLKATGWDDAKMGLSPNQAYFWSQSGPPLRFFAVPSTDGTNQFRLMSDWLVEKVNPLMASDPKLNGLKYGMFEQIGDSLVRWKGIPMLAPNLQFVGAENHFIAGGLFPNRLTNRPAPAALLAQIYSETNLVLYSWEATPPNAYGLIQMTQLGRFVFGRARFSMTNNASLPWLTVISTNLANAGTAVRLTRSNQMTFSRTSSIGFTGFELHMLADWLESPEFPRGTFTIPPDLGR